MDTRGSSVLSAPYVLPAEYKLRKRSFDVTPIENGFEMRTRGRYKNIHTGHHGPIMLFNWWLITCRELTQQELDKQLKITAQALIRLTQESSYRKLCTCPD